MEIFMYAFGAVASILLIIVAWPALREFANFLRKFLFKASISADNASDMAFYAIKAEAEESIQENIQRIEKVRKTEGYVEPKAYMYNEIARQRQLEKELKIF